MQEITWLGGKLPKNDSTVWHLLVRTCNAIFIFTVFFYVRRIKGLKTIHIGSDSQLLAPQSVGHLQFGKSQWFFIFAITCSSIVGSDSNSWPPLSHCEEKRVSATVQPSRFSLHASTRHLASGNNWEMNLEKKKHVNCIHIWREIFQFKCNSIIMDHYHTRSHKSIHIHKYGIFQGRN
jgi:hypothetical protein